MDPVSEAPASFEFGRFRILPQRREVLADGRPMELGGRAFDVLVELIEANGAVVSKGELISRVWPDRRGQQSARPSESATQGFLGPRPYSDRRRSGLPVHERDPCALRRPERA